MQSSSSRASRDEVNIIASMFARALAPNARTIARTTDVEYLEVWHERELDVDFIVSSELETAHAVSRLIGIPAARQTDVFADGQVQMVEFEVPAKATTGDVVGRPLREARIPRDAKVAGIIRGDRMILPRGDVTIEPGDRIVVIGSPRRSASGRGSRGGEEAARRRRHLRCGPCGRRDRTHAPLRAVESA